MKLLKKSNTSDVEVSMVVTANGEAYNVQVDRFELPATMSGTETYETLVNLFNDITVRVPSRFIIEFGKHVLNQFTLKDNQ